MRMDACGLWTLSLQAEHASHWPTSQSTLLQPSVPTQLANACGLLATLAQNASPTMAPVSVDTQVTRRLRAPLPQEVEQLDHSPARHSYCGHGRRAHWASEDGRRVCDHRYERKRESDERLR